MVPEPEEREWIDDSAERSVAEAAREEERGEAATRLQEILDLALESLTPEDLLILKMHYRDGMTFASIAKALKLHQRSLYTRRDSCMEDLRRSLRRDGLEWDEVREVLGWEGAGLRSRALQEKGGGSPSNGPGSRRKESV